MEGLLSTGSTPYSFEKYANVNKNKQFLLLTLLLITYNLLWEILGIMFCRIKYYFHGNWDILNQNALYTFSIIYACDLVGINL